jgi:flavodoxin
MKILLVVSSKHNENTLKIAEAMCEVTPTTICELENVGFYNLNEYDIIGLGSGIYYGKHDKLLFELVKKDFKSIKRAFVFSTSGNGKEKNNKPLINLLNSLNVPVSGAFTCKGKTTLFPFSIFGGINKNHPDMDDFEKAQEFIESML